MQMKRFGFFLAIGLAAFAAGQGSAMGQTAVSYRFLEVTDTAGKPVPDAKVEVLGSSISESHQTDANGAVAKFPLYSGDYNTRSVKVTKIGYYPAEEASYFGILQNLLQGEIAGYDPHGPIKISLLSTPLDANRTAVEAEEKNREFILNVQTGQVDKVKALLAAGVSADTVDRNGFPAILWAAASGREESLQVLLGAGASLGKPGEPGRKVLLYYLLSRRRQATPELVDRLIKAGADVNATNLMGKSIAAAAGETGNDQITALLAKAGTK